MNQFFKLNKLILKITTFPLRKLEKFVSLKNSIRLRNLSNKLRGFNHIFGFSEKEKLFYVKENTVKHYFANKERGFNLYEYGVERRSQILANSYLLKNIKFNRDDLVIDCGANYADLWIFLKNYINENSYLTFEPGLEEYNSIVLNSPKGIHHNVGLGDGNYEKIFYTNHKDADSSFIMPHKYSKKHISKIITIDNFLRKNFIKSVKLLKLEAEGFEPEILNGAKSSLKLIEYIAIDGGFERGVNKEETFTYQTNFLIKNKFEIIEINYEWKRALFKRLF